MSAGLVDGRDLVIGQEKKHISALTHNTISFLRSVDKTLCFFSVAANLQKIVDEPQANKNVTFKLVSDAPSFVLTVFGLWLHSIQMSSTFGIYNLLFIQDLLVRGASIYD